ncbi:MAG TPA: tRNA (N(6)-L-threonylcarbamoyladenosine(37)-C(2))-methylthiotransferase MtaB [Bacteroidales bacterium]|jgi:threonylcarbamoyladenosine tRNA methylthiotransferase MtaB|nr:tRNA (N(6)-L-threonylcarbamoyladenosine(37)-C(2))-methylthiotransferase MtaB [Bacteroidales bacterium]
MLSTDNRKKVAFHTLGCKLNFAETSTMSRTFPPDKFVRVPASSKADIYVINTCSVTEAADKKCRQAIRKFINLSPGAFIAVVGCYAQLSPGAVSSIPGVDLVLGTNEKFDIWQYINSTEKRSSAEIHSCDLSDSGKFYQSSSVGDRTRSFLKVQDGCDYHCSYCTIPAARGNSRNPKISSIVSEARRIASGGVKEIVLTGVNTGDFGKTTGESFHDLLKELISVEGIERYRISSIEPNLLTDEIISLAASGSVIMPHFHIPLQSGCDKILALMRRRYKRDVFAGRVKRIRELIPLAGIGADVIVGFPGENEEDFNDTYEFIKRLPLSYLHVFPFSARPGTVAAGLKEKVAYQEKMRRSKMLLGLSEEKHLDFCSRNIGQDTGILFESAKSAGMISGFTPNYIKVEYPWNAGLPGTIRRAKLTGTAHDGRMTIELTES